MSSSQQESEVEVSELRITPAQLQQVFEHVDENQGHEVCGYMVLDQERRVQQIVRGENVATFTEALYVMDSASLLDATLAYLEDHPIVIYHSHPHGSPYPSSIDTSDAEEHPNDWRYLIVGAKAFALWRFGEGDDDYGQAKVEILEDEPAPTT